MFRDLELNQVVKVNKFRFTDKEGGTSLSDIYTGNIFPAKVATVKVVKRWRDSDQIEQAYAISHKDEVLDAYLEKNANPYRYIIEGKQVVFIDERDLDITEREED